MDKSIEDANEIEIGKIGTRIALVKKELSDHKYKIKMLSEELENLKKYLKILESKCYIKN